MRVLYICERVHFNAGKHLCARHPLHAYYVHVYVRTYVRVCVCGVHTIWKTIGHFYCTPASPT
jgi:hypothetical protein